jgi:hypothetical protein
MAMPSSSEHAKALGPVAAAANSTATAGGGGGGAGRRRSQKRSRSSSERSIQPQPPAKRSALEGDAKRSALEGDAAEGRARIGQNQRSKTRGPYQKRSPGSNDGRGKNGQNQRGKTRGPYRNSGIRKEAAKQKALEQRRIAREKAKAAAAAVEEEQRRIARKKAKAAAAAVEEEAKKQRRIAREKAKAAAAVEEEAKKQRRIAREKAKAAAAVEEEAKKQRWKKAQRLHFWKKLHSSTCSPQHTRAVPGHLVARKPRCHRHDIGWWQLRQLATARTAHKIHDQPRHIWAISGSISDYLEIYTFSLYEIL